MNKQAQNCNVVIYYGSVLFYGFFAKLFLLFLCITLNFFEKLAF